MQMEKGVKVSGRAANGSEGREAEQGRRKATELVFKKNESRTR